MPDHVQCRDFLSRTNYYQFSGYARFFQVDPAGGDNHFRPGVTLAEIRRVHALDALLRDLSLRHLARVETALRARFSLHYGEKVAPYETFWDQSAYHSVGASGMPVHDLVLRDLDRSKAPFIARHRTGSGTYTDLPVWAAVEVMSFGTLSKCIEYCVEDEVRRRMASDFSVGNQGFSSQIRSFVALRNECAHGSRLWNDVAKNPPSVLPKYVGRAKRQVGQFNEKSHFKVFLALDLFNAGVSRPPLAVAVERLMKSDATFKSGILNPSPY
ncbi:Abi family protein [Nocardioides rubriscoriae]|uniref:Abi family protein n=1 Tax=Nocardioides rubriscoriae TaxID=642762 RepID=UPI0014783A21|nr:Abi family protein [Nocardioides rubriscoriae]